MVTFSDVLIPNAVASALSVIFSELSNDSILAFGNFLCTQPNSGSDVRVLFYELIPNLRLLVSVDFSELIPRTNFSQACKF